MKTNKTWEAGVTHQELRGMKGLAAAIIRQAFDDASARTAPMVEIERKYVVPEGKRNKLGEISGNDLVRYRKPEGSGAKKIKKEKMIKEILGTISSKQLAVFATEEYYKVEHIENSNQKILYNSEGEVFGYIDGNTAYNCELHLSMGKVKIYTQKIMKRKSISSQLLSKAEQDEARGFILAESNYWRAALEFWCDVADLDWLYIVKIAKQQEWYPDHLKGKI